MFSEEQLQDWRARALRVEEEVGKAIIGQSGTLRLINVALTPRLEQAWLKITPPAYTGLPPEEKSLQFKPLKALAGPLRPRLARGAHVVLSGLLAEQENAALAAYRPHGLRLVRRIPLGEWVTLVLTA